MFDSLFAKCFIGLAFLGTVAGAFVCLAINDEASTCEKAGYGAYDDATGVCVIDGNYASNLVIAAGNTANSPKPEFIADKQSITYNYLKNSVAKGATIKIVSAASDLAVDTITIQRDETASAADFVASVEKTINEINQKIGQAPTANGATYLEAISKAGRDCVSANSTRERQSQSKDNLDDGAAVLVLGSGLSDGGILNFANSTLLQSNPESIISAMEKAGELIYDLDDIKIIWSGIGETVAPQETLATSDIDNLKSIYKQVLRRRGASEVIFDESLKQHNQIDNNKYTVKTTKISDSGLPPIDVDSELLFKPDSAELNDKNAVKAELAKEQVFEKAKESPSQKIIVTGYMASGNCNGQADISLAGERAKAVKRFLIENGVTNDIEAINGGVFESEKSECDNNGVWQPSLADYRRKVRIEFK